MTLGPAKPAASDTKKGKNFRPDDPTQYKRFLEAAKKAEADETKEGADRAFKKVTFKTRNRAKESAR